MVEEGFEGGFFLVEGFYLGGEGFVFLLLFVGGAGFVASVACVLGFVVAFLQVLFFAQGVLFVAVLGVVSVIVFDVPVALEDEQVVDDVVHEAAVVADDDEAPFVVAQELLEDFECVDVEVVGGLVEYEEVGIGHEHL